MTEARTALLLALADDELVTGHRLSEWTGWVPYIEEDLALSSIAQDEIGHARVLYDLAVAGGDVDALALGRRPSEYRHAVLCERTNRDFAFTIARHFLYETADDVRLGSLESSSWKELAGIARALRMEESYHLAHARTWITRLAGGPIEARQKLADALADALTEAPGLFETLPGEDELVADGTLPRPHTDLFATWLDAVRRDLEKAGLDRVLDAPELEVDLVPTSAGAAEARVHGAGAEAAAIPGGGGRTGAHTAEFEALWEEMTGLYRAHPGASW